MPGVNLAGLIREQPQLSLFDLFQAIASRRKQMRELADNVVYNYDLYKNTLKALESPGNGGILDYSDLEGVNNDGEGLAQLTKRLKGLRPDLLSYCYKLEEALPWATEDLIRRHNIISFNNPESAGTVYLLTYAKNDMSEYVVELLASGESAAHAIQDAARMRSTKQLLDTPDLAKCIAFFTE